MKIALWMCAAALLLAATTVRAQSVYAGRVDGVMVFAGATATGIELQYGKIKTLGASAFVDVDNRHGWGLEAKGDWSFYHQPMETHVESYLGGVRYHKSFGALQPYVRGLVGTSSFTFPYKYAQGRFFTVAPGGGIDWRRNSRWRLRLIDFEYQMWPQVNYFTVASLHTVSVSTGIRVRIR